MSMQSPLDRREAAGGLASAIFVCLASVRDVYFGGLFQRLSPLDVAVVAFGLCTVVCFPIAMVRAPDGLRAILRRPADLFWVKAVPARLMLQSVGMKTSTCLFTMAAGAVLLGVQRLRRPQYWSLAGRVVLVTGGSRGLGLAVARRLVAEDARVAVCARDRETLERARDDLERPGGSVLALPCDVTDRDAVTRMVQEVTDRLGKIDALINNAGTIAVGPVETMDVEDFSRAMNVNFWGPLYAILAVLPQMRRRRSGRIVNVASIGGKISVPHLLPYSASKFALVGLSEGLRAELRHQGIEVTTVCPGLMRTGSSRHALFKGQHRKEYAWFSVSDSLPGLSMDADRAASEVVEALKRGYAERVLSAPARIGVKAQAMFPGLIAEMLAIADRLLPGPTFLSARRAVKGESSASEWFPSWLARLGKRAEHRYNQVPPMQH